MSLVDGDLSRDQWHRLIDRIDGMATHGELSVVVEDALDVGADEASRRIDSAAENGLLDKRMTGLFEEYSVAEATADGDSGPETDPEPEAAPEPTPDPTPEPETPPEDDPEPEPETPPADDAPAPDESGDSTVDSLDDIGVGETISADDLDALTAGATTSAVDVVDPAAGPETGDEHVDATVHEPDAPDSDDDTSEPDITLADLDLAAPADDHAALPSTDDVRACMAAAIDWYHDQLSEMHRDMIEHKWGISRSQQDALKIGFCPSGNGLVEHLHGLGFDALTIVRAGLASAPVVKHAYADAPNYPKFERDYGTAFDATARAIQADVIDREQVDLARVTAHAGAEGELSLYDWWDNRIIFPYWDGDQPTYMIARATGQTEDFMLSNGDAQKYLKHPVDNPWVDGDAIHEPIFGKDTVRDGNRLIVTEGVTDAIMAHQHGFACVSPVTKTFKEKHHEPLLELATAASDVFLCLDNEESGEGLKGALKTGSFLEHEGVDARIATLPRPDDSEKVDLADYLKARAREDLLSVLAEAVATTEHPDYDSDEHGPQEADADSSTPDVDGTNKSTSDETSALFDLDITDVTGMREGERGPNPVEHRGNSEDYFVITEAPGGDLGGYDHKAGHFFNALTLLLCEAGQRSVDDPTGSLSDEDIWAAWHQAKRDRHIAVDDRVPYRAILHLVRKHDLQPPETIPDSYGDDKSLLPTAYNRALRVIDQEYGLDPGREQRSDGEYIPSEAELGLDSKPETNAEARQQFFERATLKEKQSAK